MRAVEAEGFHVSVGAATQPLGKASTLSLVRAAEANMFREKSAYYSQRGIDRRNRR